MYDRVHGDRLREKRHKSLGTSKSLIRIEKIQMNSLHDIPFYLQCVLKFQIKAFILQTIYWFFRTFPALFSFVKPSIEEE